MSIIDNRIKKEANTEASLAYFINLEDYLEQVGPSEPLLDILTTKKFAVKIKKSKKKWSQITIYYDVDRNALFYDEEEEKVFYRLRDDTIKYDRVSENILEVAGTETGIIFDSVRKETIHFDKMDQV